MSDRPAKAELETVVRWRLVAAAGGFALLLVAGPLTLACLSGSQRPSAARMALSRTPPRVLVDRKVTPPPRARRAAKPAAAPARIVRHAGPAGPVAPRNSRPETLPDSTPASEPVPVREEPAEVVTPARVEPAAEAAGSPPADVPAPPSFQRIDRLPDYDLLFQLRESVPELDLDAEKGTAAKLLSGGKKAPAPDKRTARAARTPKKITSLPPLPKTHPVLALAGKRPDLAGLPFRKADRCQASLNVLRQVQQISLPLRRAQGRRAATPTSTVSAYEMLAQSKPVLDLLARNKDWATEDGVSTLVQMLQAEYPPIRRHLVEVLSSVPGRTATAALARQALFDLSPEVREAAVGALRKRPREHWRQEFLEGFRYPWPPVAQHAAEALVALDDRESVPDLRALADRPDPRAPFLNKGGKWVVREMVCVNHLRNCLLCHAPSADASDPVRGVVPTPGQPLPRLYYASQRGNFVRADITYLRQDFSVLHRVKDHGKWPELQRFDYLVRTRELSPAERDYHLGAVNARRADAKCDAPPSYPQRDAVLFALRHLTPARPVAK